MVHNQVLVPFCLAAILCGKSIRANGCEMNLAGWVPEEPESGKLARGSTGAGERKPKPYRLVLIEADSNCAFHSMELPGFIDGKRKDTAYWASGRFAYGNGILEAGDSAVTTTGKYSRIAYSLGQADSNFRYLLLAQAGKYTEKKSGATFKPVSSEEIARLQGKWGISVGNRRRKIHGPPR
jgi:hypothetical protein